MREVERSIGTDREKLGREKKEVKKNKILKRKEENRRYSTVIKRNTNYICRKVCPKWRTRQLGYFCSSIVLGLKVNESLIESEICTLIAKLKIKHCYLCFSKNKEWSKQGFM
jgi:hypothetical protein